MSHHRLARRLIVGLTLLAGAAALRAAERDLLPLAPETTLACVAFDRLAATDDANWARTLATIHMVAGAIDEPQFAANVTKLLDAVEPLAASPGIFAWIDIAGGPEPDFQVFGVIAAGDGSSRIIALLESLLAEAPANKRKETTIADTTLRGVEVPDSHMTFWWGVHRGHVVLSIGEAAARVAIERIDRPADRSVRDNPEFVLGRKRTGADESGKGMTFFFDVKSALARVLDAARKSGAELPPELDTILDALGAKSLASIFGHSSGPADNPSERTFLHVTGDYKGVLSLWRQKPLTESDLKLIPKDAYWGAVWNFDLAQFWESVQETAEAIDVTAAAQLRSVAGMSAAFVGFSITDDLLPAFGDTWAVFDAPAQGGVLFTGAVLVAEAKDAARIDASLRRIVEMARPMLLQKDVRLAVQTSKYAGRDIHYVVIGGVPSPVAPAWCIVDGWWVFGLVPQTVAAAAAQVDAKTRGGSILDVADVSAVRAKLPQSIMSFSYSDDRALLRSIYPLVMLAGNALLSMAPESAKADLLLVPPVEEALTNVRQTVCTTSRETDGVLYAQIGGGGPIPVGIAAAAMGVSILLPSLSRAREIAKRSVSQSNLKGIGMGCHVYANDNADKFPPDLDALIRMGAVTEQMLRSPRDEADGRSYVYIAGQSPGRGNPANDVLAYERLTGEEGTNVLFGDGHVQWMKLDEFRKAVRETYQRLKREAELPAEFR